ncbi:MAG: 3-methyl-2-oxobutanoate hydroxymethyltransferase [Candidatus Celaenobacter antarcticus]|nr:3-methyl-2-oxobutanoate hydroxymethyltransferase [Candidatus Celaenobacter antarcticus]
MKKTIRDFRFMKRKNIPICWITAYDYPLALCAESVGIDMILIGDSGGMVQLGYETTNAVQMDEMIYMAKAVHRGAPKTFLVGDMPQGSYEVSDSAAVSNALRFIKEASCDAIKLEGGRRHHLACKIHR